MKKKVYGILLIIVIILIFGIGESDGFEEKDLKIEVIVEKSVFERQSCIEAMNKYFGWNASDIFTTMKIETTMRLEKASSSSYCIYVGSEDENGWTPKTYSNVPKDDLTEIYGYNESYGEEPWDVVLLVSPYTTIGQDGIFTQQYH